MNNRYDSETWKRLEQLQNLLPHIDILTITGFMDNEQLQNHLRSCELKVKNQGV